MRRFSQRSALVTLSEINITPLLDLAFVLLIIFVITTPLLDKGINLTLPKGGVQEKKLEARDVRTVEIRSDGVYYFKGTPISLANLQANLARDRAMNPNLVVYIRADEKGRWKEVAAILDFCQNNNIKVSARTQPPTPPAKR
jgi:biopolymer transport protein ExbD